MSLAAMSPLPLTDGWVDVERRRCGRGAVEGDLTELEARLIDALRARPGVDLPREEIARTVWGHPVPDHTLDALVSRVRKKIEIDPARPRHLLTARGTGYKWLGLVPVSTCTLPAEPPSPAATPVLVTLAGLVVNLGTREIAGTAAAGDRLTAQEAELLRRLVDREGHTVSFAELALAVCSLRGATRALSQVVYRLRTKIEPEPTLPRFVHTVRGQGYRFERPRPHAVLPATEPLIGREAAVREVTALLEPGALVTLCGMGGIGKTAVALAAGAAVQRALGEPATFVDASPLTTSDDLVAAVAAALQLGPGADADRVARALAWRGAVLLVIDNFETVAPPGAAVVADWVARAPALRTLVTSREPIGIDRERRFPLAPLPPPHRTWMSPASSPAVRLFLRVAKRVRPNWQPTPDDLVAIGRIVTALDGVPLAIEMAARRVASHRLADIQADLDPARPGPGARDAPDRHASVSRALDASWAHLQPEHRSVLLQLAVFHGPFDLAAATAIARVPERGPTVAEAIDALAQKGWVRLTGEPPAWHMLSPARAYVSARGETASRTEGWGALAADRHAEWVAALPRDPLRPYATDRRAAIRHALARGAVDTAAAVFCRGPFSFAPSESQALGTAVLDRLGTGSPRWWQVAYFVATAHGIQGHSVLADERYRAVRDWAREHADPLAEAHASTQIAIHDDLRGDPGAADLLDHALALYREAGPHRWEALAQVASVRFHHRRGDHPAALRAIRAALRCASRFDDPVSLGMAWYMLGNHLTVFEPDYPRATRALAQAIRVAARFGDVRTHAMALTGLSEVLRCRGRPRKAEQLARRAVELLERHGSADVPQAAFAVARALEARDRLREAADTYARVARASAPFVAAHANLDCARVYALLQEFDLAAVLLDDVRSADPPLGPLEPPALVDALGAEIAAGLGSSPDLERALLATSGLPAPMRVEAWIHLAKASALGGDSRRGLALLEAAREVADGTRCEPRAPLDHRLRRATAFVHRLSGR